MKKQILFLILFVAAIVAGTSNAFAQEYVMLPGIAPKPLTGCSSSTEPLHPMAGVPYTYKIGDAGGETSVTQWTWWATKDPTFVNGTVVNMTNILSNPGDLINASAAYGTTSGSDSVVITWSPEILAATQYQTDASGWATASASTPTPTFIVAVADGDCANNIEVLEINPVPSFTVDIANIDGNGNAMGYGVDTSQCVDVIHSATYNNSTFFLDMDYGYDTLYFEIVAANFVTSWTPTFQVTSGFTTPQTADFGLATSLANAQAGTFINGSAQTITLNTEWTGPVLGADASVSSTAAGVSVWARVIITNSTYESLASQTFSISVDGEDSSGQWDIDENNCSDAANAVKDYYDVANHNILPRPTLNRTDTNDSGAPNPTQTLPKTDNTSGF